MGVNEAERLMQEFGVCLLKNGMPLVPLYRCNLVSIAGRTDFVGPMLVGESPEPRN
jgi:hypothetical protein